MITFKNFILINVLLITQLIMISCNTKNKVMDSDKIELPDYFIRAEELSWKDHINVQATFQTSQVKRTHLVHFLLQRVSVVAWLRVKAKQKAETAADPLDPGFHAPSVKYLTHA